MISPDEMDEDFGGPLDPSVPRSSSASECAAGDAQEVHLQDKEDRLAAMEERLAQLESALQRHEQDHHNNGDYAARREIERAIESHEREYDHHR